MRIKKQLLVTLAIAFIGQVCAASTFEAVQVETNTAIEIKLSRIARNKFEILFKSKGQTVAAYGCSITGSNRLTGNYRGSVDDIFSCGDLDPQTLLTKGEWSSIKLSGNIDGEHEEGVIKIQDSHGQRTEYKYNSKTQAWH